MTATLVREAEIEASKAKLAAPSIEEVFGQGPPRREVKRIALGGGFGSGKTTAAKYLVEDHGFTILGFATPLYELADLHRLPRIRWPEEIARWTARNLTPLLSPPELEEFAWLALEAFRQTPVVEGKNRTLLQRLGTEVGRRIDPRLWIRLFARNVRELGPDAKICNDNLRFENEFYACRDLGFRTVYLDVPKGLAAARYEAEYGQPPTPEQLAHSSEGELETIRLLCDHVLDNSGGLARLYVALDGLVRCGEARVGGWGGG